MGWCHARRGLGLVSWENATAVVAAIVAVIAVDHAV